MHATGGASSSRHDFLLSRCGALRHALLHPGVESISRLGFVGAKVDPIPVDLDALSVNHLTKLGLQQMSSLSGMPVRRTIIPRASPLIEIRQIWRVDVKVNTACLLTDAYAVVDVARAKSLGIVYGGGNHFKADARPLRRFAGDKRMVRGKRLSRRLQCIVLERKSLS
jgi:hypothetical protein